MGCYGNEYSEPSVSECEQRGSKIDEDGDSTESCSYSPVECEKCGYSPCDESC